MSSSFEQISMMLPGYFSGDCSEEDRGIIENWRKESPEHEKEFAQFRKAWEAYPLLHEMEQYNTLEALEKVHHRIDRKVRNKWMTGLQRIAAVLMIPLLVYSGFMTFKNLTQPKVATPEPVWQTISTPPGVKTTFFLPDSTRVWLNSSSSITFPGTFAQNTRQVSITGEAFLDVRANEEQPFVVGLGKINMKVLGTRFDVIHYEKEKQSEIILESGKISLFQGTGADEQGLATLRPGEKALFDKAQHRIGITRVQTQKYTSWINGKLIFRDDPMDEVVRKLNRWFNVEITIADPEIEKYVYTATFQDESIDQILELLTISAPIRYRVIQREMENDMFKAKKIILRKKSK